MTVYKRDMKNNIIGNKIAFFKGKMLSISNLIFNPPMHTGRIRDYYPIGSPVMREMTLLKIKYIQSMVRVLKDYYRGPPKRTYIPSYYLPSTAISYRKNCLFVLRSPLPNVGRIVKGFNYRLAVIKYRASEYCFRGFIEKLFIFKDIERLKEMTVKISDRINLLEKRYDPFSSFLDTVRIDINRDIFETCCGRMTTVVRYGYSIWYTLIPVLITNIGVFKTHGEILTPDMLNTIKEMLIEWADLTIKQVSVVFDQINGNIMRVESTSADVTESDKIMMEASKIVISRLVIASLTVCILATAAYVAGDDLIQQYSDMKIIPFRRSENHTLSFASSDIPR